MNNRPTVSIKELEAIMVFLEQEGNCIETMFGEYQACITELLTVGIMSGEVHNSLVFYLQSAEILRDKFNLLTEIACEQITMLRSVVEESDERALY